MSVESLIGNTPEPIAISQKEFDLIWNSISEEDRYTSPELDAEGRQNILWRGVFLVVENR